MTEALFESNDLARLPTIGLCQLKLLGPVVLALWAFHSPFHCTFKCRICLWKGLFCEFRKLKICWDIYIRVAFNKDFSWLVSHGYAGMTCTAMSLYVHSSHQEGYISPVVLCGYDSPLVEVRGQRVNLRSELRSQCPLGFLGTGLKEPWKRVSSLLLRRCE